jgi:hypothetical protein
MKNAICSAIIFHENVTLSFVIPKPTCPGVPWRDLQFRGPFLEARNSILKQNCHLACPGVPWDRSVAERRDLRFVF